MSDEQAIEFIKYYMKQYFYEDISIEDDFKFEDAIKTVLNLIQSQQKEIESLKQAGEATETVYKIQLEKKDKIIDLMAKHLEKYSTNFLELYGANMNDWKQYFEKKVEGK